MRTTLVVNIGIKKKDGEMIKLKISELENKLGKKLKRNFTSVGVDTATICGVGFISTSDKEIEINWSLIKFEANSMTLLYKQMYNEFGNFIDKSVDFVVVEDVFLGMSPAVTIKLSRFGGLVIAHAIKNDIHFETIGASSSRAKLFTLDKKLYKGKPKEAVANYLKSLGIEIDEDNCADGVILALLGVIEGMDFRSNAEIAKEKKAIKKMKKKLKAKRKK
jgi:Holliday junction resolvasome RuvABC endonuclease subunit